MNRPTLPGIASGIERSATIDPTGQYRYALARRWGDPDGPRGVANFVLLNPSTADAAADDPTARRCIRFARDWGYSGLVITNLFAYRSTDPQALFSVPDPVGPENDLHLANAALGSELVVLAWGHLGWVRGRAAAVTLQLARLDVRCHTLGLTAHGEPKHPLYLKTTAEPVPFDLRRAEA